MKFGLHQLKAKVDGARQGGKHGVWMARRAIPKDVREHFRNPRTGKARAVLVQSTGTTILKDALPLAEGIFRAWGLEFAAARQMGSGPVLTLEVATFAVDRWRERECEFAGSVDRRAKREAAQLSILADYKSGIGAAVPPGGDVVLHLSPTAATSPTAPHSPLAGDFLDWATRYFAERPGASRSPERPRVIDVRMEALQAAIWEASGWAKIPGFDASLDAAVIAGGASGTMTPITRDRLRPVFARAALEVERHREAERARAAAFLAALEASTLTGERLTLATRTGTYTAEPGDHTVSEMIAAFKEAQGDAADLLDKTHGHVFKALEELIGGAKPVRAVTRQDVRDVIAVLEKLPSNASKLYPGVSLREASVLGAAAGRPRLAPNTVRSYAVSLKGLFTFAVAERLADINPVDGQIPAKLNMVKRKAFSREQLDVLFAALERRRAVNSAYFWVPAILAFHGARANEISQLHVEDVKEVNGVAYFDMTYFNDNGELLDRRLLKTAPSERCLPLHAEIIAAGFLDFVAARRASGDEQLFGDLKQSRRGYFTEALSKFWGKHCDACGFNEKSLVLHSLRHGWKDDATASGLSDTVVNALGGWGQETEREKYGDQRTKAKVPENAEFLNKVTLGGFTLGPPPAPRLA